VEEGCPLGGVVIKKVKEPHPQPPLLIKERGGKIKNNMLLYRNESRTKSRTHTINITMKTEKDIINNKKDKKSVSVSVHVLFRTG